MPLSACTILDCENAPAPGSAFCPGHLASQRAASAGISEPEVEEAAAAAARAFEEREKMAWEGATSPIRVASTNEGIGQPPDPTTLEPHWDGTQWVLRPRPSTPDLRILQSLVRKLMAEVGIEEADDVN